MGDKSPVVTPAVAALTQSGEIDGTESLSVASKSGQIVKTRPSGGVGPEWEGV